MSRDDYMTEPEVASFLGLAKATMEKRRSLRKDHPPYIKIGKTVLYPKADLKKWMDAHLTREFADDGGNRTDKATRQVRASSR